MAADPATLPLLPGGQHLSAKIGFDEYPAAVKNAVEARWAEAIARGLRTSRIQLEWVDLEPAPLQYDMDPLTEALDDFENQGLSTLVMVAAVDTAGVFRPSDLNALPFSDPLVLERYKALMDRVVPIVRSRGGYAISVGNEPLAYLEQTPGELAPMAAFIAGVRDHVRTLDPDLAVTMTLNGDPDSWAQQFAALADASDVLVVNHYGIGGEDFQAKDPDDFSADLQRILSYGGSKPLILQELGMPAGWEDELTLLATSPELVQDFMLQVIDEMRHTPRLRVAYWFTLVDWSDGAAQLMRNSLESIGFEEPQLSRVEEWLRTSGLLRYEHPAFADATERPAWQDFLNGIETLRTAPPVPVPGVPAAGLILAALAVGGTALRRLRARPHGSAPVGADPI